MDRLVSSWQKIGDYVDSYTYYGYDDMGRAYKSDFCLMGTAGGTLTQTYEYTYDADDGSLTDMDITVNGSTEESIHYEYDTLKRVNRKSMFLKGDDIEYFYTYKSLLNGRKTNLISEYSVYMNYGTPYAFAYTYDALGNITKITNDGETVAEYTYDDQGQLSSETIVSENVRYNYFYDTYGNLASAHKYNLTTGAYISSDYYGYGSWGYGDENGWHDRLTSFNDGSITYDAIGNPLSYYNGNEKLLFVIF